MSDEAAPMRPADQTVYLLGKLDGQVASMQASLDNATKSQADINASLRTDVNRAQATADTARSETALLAGRVPARTPWYQVGSGLAGYAALILAAIALVPKFFQ